MFDPSRQSWIAAALLPALGLCSSCASLVPDGELPCDTMAVSASCPASVPVCEQRVRDDAAFCYRDAQAGVARPRSPLRQQLPMPASRSYRLIEQSVAKTDGTTVQFVAGR
jgi:hypothetical protein